MSVEGQQASGAALPDTSPSVADFVGGLHGDFGFSAEPTPDAGSTPAPGSDPATPEGTDPSQAPGPDASTDPAPDSSTPAPPDTASDADPLEGSTPHLAYTVSGQERQFAGITVLKDGDGIIDAAAMPKLVERLAAHDHLYEQDRARHAELQSYQKLTEWQTKGANGEPVTLSGRAGIEARHVTMAELATEVQAYRDLLSNPENLRDVLKAIDDGTPDGKLDWNQAGVKAFRSELRANMLEAVANARARIGTLAQPAQPAPFNPTALAASAATQAITLTGAKGFTDADKQWAEALAPRFVRITTPEDARGNPALVVGQPMIEQQFLDLVKERGELRAASAKTVSGATDAAKANAAKIAAAKAGQRTGTQAATLQPTKQPERTRDDDFDDAFSRQERAAAGALRAHAAGR